MKTYVVAGVSFQCSFLNVPVNPAEAGRVAFETAFFTWRRLSLCRVRLPACAVEHKTLPVIFENYAFLLYTVDCLCKCCPSLDRVAWHLQDSVACKVFSFGNIFERSQGAFCFLCRPFFLQTNVSSALCDYVLCCCIALSLVATRVVKEGKG